MADVKLSNIANVTENYDSIPTTLTSKAVITDMIAGLTLLLRLQISKIGQVET